MPSGLCWLMCTALQRVTHQDGLVFQTSRCCWVLGQENDRQPDAAAKPPCSVHTALKWHAAL